MLITKQPTWPLECHHQLISLNSPVISQIYWRGPRFLKPHPAQRQTPGMGGAYPQGRPVRELKPLPMQGGNDPKEGWRLRRGEEAPTSHLRKLQPAGRLRLWVASAPPSGSCSACSHFQAELSSSLHCPPELCRGRKCPLLIPTAETWPKACGCLLAEKTSLRANISSDQAEHAFPPGAAKEKALVFPETLCK